MTIRILPDYESLSRTAANLIAEQIKSNPTALVCIASGHSPVGTMRCLADEIADTRLDISRCTFISLDEWLGIPASEPGSCRRMMDDDFFRPARIPEKQIVFFNGMSSDPEKECERLNHVIADHDGLDVMLVGIGLNGHIAMNEPGTPADSYAHVAELSDDTKAVGQKYFSRPTVLSRGLTLGLKHFSEARLPILMANGSKKAAIVRQALRMPVGESLPASIIQNIPSAVVLLDEEAAADL